MTRPLYLIGGGGHAKAVIEIVEKLTSHQIIGIVELESYADTQLLGYEILTEGVEFSCLPNANADFLVAIGQVKDATPRVRSFNKLKSLNKSLATILSTLSHVSERANVGEGSIIMDFTMVGPDVHIGKNCIVNNFAQVEHDSTIGDHCHLSTNTVVNGGCELGDKVFLGSGSIILNGISIGSQSIIAAGEVVRMNVPEKCLFVGGNIKYLETRDEPS